LGIPTPLSSIDSTIHGPGEAVAILTDEIVVALGALERNRERAAPRHRVA